MRYPDISACFLTATLAPRKLETEIYRCKNIFGGYAHLKAEVAKSKFNAKRSQ
ncbi:MAG: hypothetical protein OQK51_17650 [Kangiellaceae bacterium]|nr:hypothetical protein [Kangiellaceae bacterium]